MCSLTTELSDNYQKIEFHESFLPTPTEIVRYDVLLPQIHSLTNVCSEN